MNKQKPTTDKFEHVIDPVSDSLLDKQSIINGFNRASKSYDKSAILQREISTRLLERLEWIKIEPEIIVDLGGGTGDASLKLAKKYPHAQIVVIDIAEQMLQIAKTKYNLSLQNGSLNKKGPVSRIASRIASRIGSKVLNKIKAKLAPVESQQINYICADAENIPLAKHKVDLIISNLTIQWCEHTQQLFNELQRILKPSGCLLFSTFGVDTLTELKQSWSTISQSPHVNNFTDMHDLGDAMLVSGLDDPVMDSETIIMEYTKLADLFKDLKQIGAQNHLQNRSKGLTTISKFKTMQIAYEQFKLSNGKYPASYEVVYGHAWGKELTVAVKKMKRNTSTQPINFVKFS